MKKLVIILSVLIAAVLALFLGSEKEKRPKIAPPPESNIDEDMAGPRGEEIFIGSGGGRYYIKDDRKIYVGYKGEKQHAS
ncbi:MAG: hypothetical protein ABIN97_17485 [Ginsengibacter sp.]